MAVRMDGWKMHIGVKHKGTWFDEKSYPSIPYIVNLLMDPMEKMPPDSEEWGYIGIVSNPLNSISCTQYIPELAGRGVSIEHSCR